MAVSANVVCKRTLTKQKHPPKESQFYERVFLCDIVQYEIDFSALQQ